MSEVRIVTRVLTPADQQREAFHGTNQLRRERDGIALWQTMNNQERADVVLVVHDELTRLLGTIGNWIPASVRVGSLNQLEITINLPLAKVRDHDARDRLQALTMTRDNVMAQLVELERELRAKL
jgi:hypothetical protein